MNRACSFSPVSCQRALTTHRLSGTFGFFRNVGFSILFPCSTLGCGNFGGGFFWKRIKLHIILLIGKGSIYKLFWSKNYFKSDRANQHLGLFSKIKQCHCISVFERGLLIWPSGINYHTCCCFWWGSTSWTLRTDCKNCLPKYGWDKGTQHTLSEVPYLMLEIL